MTVNTKGLLTVKQDGKTLASQQVVEAGTYSYPTKLTVGNNKFQIQFEPDATQNINPKDTITQNNTVVRKHRFMSLLTAASQVMVQSRIHLIFRQLLHSVRQVRLYM